MKSFNLSLIMILSMSTLNSCQQVRAWERGMLARPEMGWDSDPLGGLLQDHIFFSKEAS